VIPLDAGEQVLNIQHVRKIPHQPACVSRHPRACLMSDAIALAELSRRERQIMEIVYRRGRATAAEVLGEIPDPPTYSAVRAALRLLEEKGRLSHEMDGKRFVYVPTTPRSRARTTALKDVVRNFFGGSAEQVVNALLEDQKPSAAELDRLARLIAQARREAGE
jgi:predicted transcriptional regulator